MSRGKTRQKYNDSWMYILLLSTLVILIESLKTYKFSLFGTPVTYSMFLIPFIFTVTNYITKKYGFRRTLTAIIISTIALIAFVTIMNFAVGREMNFSSISGGLLGYLISQLVNTMIYKFLLVNTNSPFVLIILNYIFGYIVFYMLYTIVHLDTVVTSAFWKSYFIVLGIQAVMSIVLTVFDKKIKVGLSKDD